MFATGEVIQHYTTLYSCKFFRNRVLRLQKLCADLGLDAIVLINGDDVHRDREMGKLCNWLLFGLSSNDICGGIYNSSLYEDSFFVISKDGFQAYTSSQGFKELSNLTTLVQNCNLYILTKSDEAESEISEVKKMSRFYEMIHDKKSIGMPVRRLNPTKDFVSSEKEIIEKWPIIQAYGLDMVGGGFFTMKHAFKLVREELNSIYKDYDAFTKYRAVNEEIIRLNTHYFDNFYNFNKDTPTKRTQRTEHDLIESFWLRYQHSLVQRKNVETRDQEDNDGLPLTRVLIGANSNKPFSEVSDTEARMFKFNNIDDKNGALHFTMEYTEKNTNLRFARTYFLSNLSQNYMKNMFFTQDEDERTTDPQGKINEQNTKVLFDVYSSVIKAYQECSENYLKGTTSAAEIQNGTAFAAFKTFMTPKCENFDKLLKNGKESFVVDIHHINTYGQSTVQNEKCNQDRLIMIRIQVKDIMSQAEQDNNLGSVVFAQSFIVIENNQIYINVTKGVPNLQCWFTNHKHFQNLPREIDTLKNLDNEHLGERILVKKGEGGVLYQNIHGLLPIKEDQQNEFDDIVLNGKLVFYQKGMIFVDSKLHSIVLPWCMIKEMNVYVTKDWWLEIIAQDNEDLGIKAADLFPSNMIAHQKMYLKIDQKFYEDKFKYLEKEFLVNKEKNLDGNSMVKRVYAQCPLVKESQAMKNFFVNQKYHKVQSSDFLSFEFDEETYLEYMEYNSLSEFNRTKGKEFLPFTSYSKHYKDAKQEAYRANSKSKDLIEKLVDGTKTNVIIVSGIPGSGKGRLADFISKQVRMENVPSTNFKMATVQENVKFSSESFIKAMIQFKNTDEDAKNAKVIVATLPSYNHLKKAIFDLKKSEAFGALFNINFVVTKVAAKNFYTNKNRNCYQYLIENCLKGVSNAVIFEKQNMPQGEIDIMLRTLQNANFSRNVILTSGKTFEFDDLAKVICYQNEKFSQLYNKFFYGFEKEGKSAYYQDNSVSGAYFNYRYLFNPDMVKEQLKQSLSLPLNEDTITKFIRVKAQSELDIDAKKAADEEEKFNALEPLQKKRYLREKKRKAQLEEDLVQEKILREEMELIKRKVGSLGTKEPFVERFRGYVNIEGENGTNQDHQMCINFGDLSIKGLKNQANRLDKSQLGFLVYGKNLTDAKGNVQGAIKETLKCAKTHLTEKKDKRTRDSVTEEEILELENANIGQEMPNDGSDWQFTGRGYVNSQTGANLYEHPNREFLIQRFLDEENGTVAAFNEDVTRQWQEDAQTYE